MPRYTDPKTGKSISSKTPLNESQIREGLGLATMPEPEGAITKTPSLSPSSSFRKAWSSIPGLGLVEPETALKTGAELGSFIFGGPVGYAATRQALSLLPFGPPPRPLAKADVEKELGFPLTNEEFQNVIATNKRFQAPSPTEKVVGETLGRAGEVGTDIALTSMFRGGGKLSEKALPEVLPFYAKGRTPGALEAMRIAEREGITPTPADITGHIGQSGMESTVSRLPQSAFVAQKATGEALRGHATAVEREIAKLGGRVEPQLAGERAIEELPRKVATEIESQFGGIGGKLAPDLTGQTVKEGIATVKNEARQTGHLLFEGGKKIEEIPIAVDPITNTIAKIKESGNYRALSAPDKNRVDSMIKYIESRINPPEGGLEELGGFQVGGRTIPIKGRELKSIQQMTSEERETAFGALPELKYLDVEGIRRTVANTTFSDTVKKSPAYGPLRQLYDAVDKALESSAKVAGSDIHDAFKISRSFWKDEIIDRLGEGGTKSILGRIEKASPEQVVSIIKKSNEDELRQLVSVLPKESLQPLKRGLFTDLLETGSKVNPNTGEIVYNGTQINKAINNQMGRLRVLLSPDEVRYLKKFAVDMSEIAPVFKVATGTAEGAIQRLKIAPLEELATLKNNLTPEGWINYRQGLITKIFSMFGKKSPVTNEYVYNGPRIFDAFLGPSGLGEARLKVLTDSPEELQTLRELLELGNKMGSSWRIAGNPSGTAHALYNIHLLSQMGKMIGGGGITGGILGYRGGEEDRAGRTLKGAAIGGAVGAFLGPYAVAKFITSNIGRRYLISGFPQAERALGRILPLGAVGTRGILSKEPQKVEMPKVTAPINYDKEISQARAAISQGKPIDKVKEMFKSRTGQEYPE